MRIKSFYNFLLLNLLIFSSNLYGVYEAFDEDLALSKKIPLISGIKNKDIIEGRKAAITVCTTPLGYSFFSYDHVSLVFEIKHPERDEINLFSVHFGGDGNSSNIEKGRPTIDNSHDTLKKVYRGKEATLFDDDYIEPIYSRKIVFVVEKNNAIDALKNIENDNDLNYSLAGSSWMSKKKTYNCCTYANKILKDVGIDTGFDQSYYLKNATSFTSYCFNYNEKEHQIKSIPKEYCDSLDIDEYKSSVNDLFEEGLKLKIYSNYNESMKYILESAKRGHAIAQCFLAFCHYNNDKVKDEYNGIFKHAQNYRESVNDETSKFYNLISNYNEFSSCAYFKKSITKYDEKEAFKWIKRSADKNFPRAESDLGFMYAKGRGIYQDDSEAVKWYKKAADQGDAIAQVNLGFRYAKGRGIYQDDSEAVKWYKKAAKQGYAVAQSKLGFRYAKGKGVPQNDAKAIKWYKKAADQGLDEARDALEKLYINGRKNSKNEEEDQEIDDNKSILEKDDVLFQNPIFN